MTSADYAKVVGLSEFIISPKYSFIVDSVTPLDRIVLPEPSTWVLLITAAGLFAIRHRRPA
ncbi:MAG: PEP-CTERM sorting domain-containing protein [Planctomycetaceae bacterium]